MKHVSIRTDVALAPFTTYKVGGEARWYAEPYDLEQLRSILDVVPADTKIVILGRGSNVVVSDSGIDGLVVRLGGAFAAVDVTQHSQVVAGGAVALPKLARLSAEAGRSGLEFYVGIPGSVGGAVYMNAGGHGADTASVLLNAVVVDLGTGHLSIRDVASLGYEYRHSNLASSDVVVQATFEVSEADPEELTATLRDITQWRRTNQPGGSLSAGSVFKNPPGQSAGEIIDQCGLKGLSVGGSQVSDKHANFVTASTGTSARDIFLLVAQVQKKVLEMTGIKLEPEIRFLGEFEVSGDVS